MRVISKPLDGWRGFVGEIAIVVIGVLIALGAQSVVEDWRWQAEVRTAQAAFRDELLNAGAISYERLIIQRCLQGRISALSEQLRQPGESWTAAPMLLRSNSFRNVMPVAYRAPSRPLPRDGWHNAIGNGTLSHLKSAEVRALSAIYEQVASFDASQEDEAKAAATLTPLAFDGRLASPERTAMLSALGEVDRINAVMALQASQIIEAIQARKLKFPKSEVQTIRRELMTGQRVNRGTCVADLPLDLG